jgi:multidrug transporter EmrE-like cation transporter
MVDLIERFLDDSAMRFATVMAIIETFADYCLKKYAQTDGLQYILGGLGGYGGVVYVFQRALRKDDLGRVNGGWNAITSISNVLLGMSMGEKYSMTQLLGFILISCGILLI